MKSYVSLITLGVTNLQKSFAFYTSLGFPSKGIEGDVVFFPLKNIHLSLYPKEKLAEEARVSTDTTGTPFFSGFTLAHNVSTVEEVDILFKELEKTEAVITAPPVTREWGGYSGYFKDLDGYIWEVAYNPFSPEMVKEV